MDIFKKTFEFTISESKEYFCEHLELLSGWQSNRHSWQQGRVRKIKYHVENEQSVSMSITTSFMGLVSLARLNIQIQDKLADRTYIVKIEAKFAWGILIFIAFFMVFFAATYVSKFVTLIMLPFYVMYCGIAYKVFQGIYRDRENLMNDLMQIQNHS